MKSINIRSLKHEMTEVFERVALGESLEIRRRDQPLAVLKPIESKEIRPRRPDFRQRLRDVYGDEVLSATGTELLGDERGER